MTGRQEVTRLRATLAALIDLSGLSRSQIERCLAEQDAGVDLTRLLSGRFALKLYHLLDILEVLQVHPLEFFRLIFPAPETRSPLMARLASLFNPTSAKAVRPTAPSAGSESAAAAGRGGSPERSRSSHPA